MREFVRRQFSGLRCPDTHLSPIQRFGYAYAGEVLKALKSKGCLQPEKVYSVCDFGAGCGGPSLALRDFFKLSGPQFTLLEQEESQIAQLRQILPTARIFSGDGLYWLKTGNQQTDLITAFMLGPDHQNKGFVQEFILFALSCLSDKGRLLISSDTATMHQVQYVLSGLPGMECAWLLDGANPLLPVTVMVSRSRFAMPNPSDEPIVLPTALITRIDIPEADGFWSTEEYCLATAFEKAYFKATLDTFEQRCPEHPAISFMRDLWREISLPDN